jgi:transposase-like protein
MVAVRRYLRYVYRAVDQHGQVIDVLVSRRRNLQSAEKFFGRALAAHDAPVEVVTDKAHALVRVIAELLPIALHDTRQYANNRIEADHGRLKARLGPMRGLKTDRTAAVVKRGHAFVQNLRRGQCTFDGDARHPLLRVAAAFDELATLI